MPLELLQQPALGLGLPVNHADTAEQVAAGRKEPGRDAFEQVACEDQVIVTQGQDVGLVSP
ncbi:hypothetical protein [Silanimonas sp.]|uniref:hypothetical protein n=1 Tax=Silanimonas sp. TaxID=1929290 RepID=UPI0022BF714F|nr:hypothetical protein [Silanimonas sp.]MCZ8167471.1 hypothetical protein [Silanimonas sp.]